MDNFPDGHPLAGVREKLKRADENIINLNTEITTFLGKGKHAIFPNENNEAFQKAIEGHAAREVPLRFSVLAGETIHHLRSSLDHVMWLLSSEQYRAECPNKIEFPVCAVKPASKDEIAKYNGKIEGINSANAKAIIQSFQPYKRLEKGESPEDDLLWIVHDFDRFDKHRELVMVLPSIGMSFPPAVLQRYIALQEKAITEADFERDVNMYSQFAPQVSFRQFGKRECEPVIKGLTKLSNYVRDLVGCFASEFK
jgi:hypothetical protein